MILDTINNDDVISTKYDNHEMLHKWTEIILFMTLDVYGLITRGLYKPHENVKLNNITSHDNSNIKCH